MEGLTVVPGGVNTQPAEGPDLREDGSLDVHSTFYTIQGECIFAGRPAVFLRLAGCTLLCGGCDTEYTRGRERHDLTGVWTRILLAEPHHRTDRTEDWGGTDRFCRLLVVTGGEPFRQNLGPLVRKAREARWEVQIETNGTLPAPYLNGDLGIVPHGVTVVCSPKTAAVHPWVYAHAHHWKYVLSHDAVSPDDGLPTSSLSMPSPPCRPPRGVVSGGRVWVQPMDSGDPEADRKNVRAAAESCMRYGWRLSIQTHKIAGVP